MKTLQLRILHRYSVVDSGAAKRRCLTGDTYFKLRNSERSSDRRYTENAARAAGGDVAMWDIREETNAVPGRIIS